MIYRIIASVLLLLVLGFLYAAFSGEEQSPKKPATTQSSPGSSYSGFGK